MTMHTWKFVRAGGFQQVRLDSGADIAALPGLDQKLWAALSCPTRGLEFDNHTLDLVDLDHDGRIRVPEILAATRFALGCLKNADDLLQSSPSLPLAAIDDRNPEGRAILESARQILVNLGKRDAAEITVEDTTDTARIFAATLFNGDGIVPPEGAPDAATHGVMRDILAIVGSEADRCGKPGVSEALVARFFAEATAWSAWWAEAEASAAILPFGDDTAAAYAALEAVRAKIEDYFTRCRLVAFDPRAAGPANRADTEYVLLATKDLSAAAVELAGFPLARVEAGRALPLVDGVNPAWIAALTTFQRAVVVPVVGGRTMLTEADWDIVRATFAPHGAWLARVAGASVAKLGLPRVREILAGPYRATIDGLIATDKEYADEANAISTVDRLVRYHRDLYKLLNNFVTLHEFYAKHERAIFQSGVLYLDQRSCDLCIRVQDLAVHSALAGLSGTYIAYCEIRRGLGEKAEKATIAAGFTAGDAINLMVGRNGLFYDRHGQDWDATIVKIIEHPISIRQAFFAPYRRIARIVEDQVAQFASAKDKAVDGVATAKVVDEVAVVGTAAVAAKKKEPFDIGRFAGIFAAIALAVGSIGGAIGAVAAAFSSLHVWQMPLAVVGALLLVSGPSMLIAALKLRQRNLGPLLDGNGWAINARAHINIPFGRSLTAIPDLPPGAQVDLIDPYDRPGQLGSVVWKVLLVVGVLVALWGAGVFDRWLPDAVDSPTAAEETPAAPTGAAAAPAAPVAP